jgi:hypothetical protein
LGGKIPKNIKETVISQWLQGLTRETIAKENDIGTGTVSAIIKEARQQKEYHNVDLLRQISTKLREEGLEPAHLGFAIRLKKIMEETDIREDQLESLILDFNTYCLRHNLTFDRVFESGYEALNLAYKFGISVEKIPEYINQGKKMIDRIEDQRQEILRQERQAREERDTIVAELERYGKEIPSIKRIKELETELDKAKRLNEHYETSNRRLTKELADARREAATSEGDAISIHARWKDTASRLPLCQNELEEIRGRNQ